MSVWWYWIISYAVFSVGMLSSLATLSAAYESVEEIARRDCTLAGLAKLLTCWLLVGVQLLVVLLVPLWLLEIFDVVLPW